MKSSLKLILSLLVLSFIFSTQTAEAQFIKKLKKRAEKAAEEAVIRKTEEKVYKETSNKMDTIYGNDGKKKGKKPTNTSGDKNPNDISGQPNVNSGSSDENKNSGNKIEVYSKFDFVPGDKLLFFDDFEKDYIGDFTSKLNTNGSGDIPDVKLPEEYTIEFDVLVTGIDKKTSSTAVLYVKLSNDTGFKRGDNYFHVNIPFCQYAAIGFRVKNNINSGAGSGINNVIKADIREVVLNQPHISIAVIKQRFRLWVNEKMYVDIPRAIPENTINTLKFELNNFKDGKERLFLRNLKVAEGGVDLRRKLIEEGSVSTNGILFDSGSANIQPQSYGLIRQISQVLQQETAMKLNIIGHTDADGSDEANLALSKKRADAVREALISVYNISGDRLQTDGKGESVPLGDNKTADGKAQNRRVEFIKI